MFKQTANEWNDDDFHVAHAVRSCYGEQVSGDEVILVRADDYLLLGVIDGLGHGKEAADVAERVKIYIEEHHHLGFETLIQNAHQYFLGSRGVVLGLAKIFVDGDFEFIGIGNIRARVISEKDRLELVSKDGALGVRMRSSLFLQKTKMQKGDRLVMYSDGVSNRIFRENVSFPRAGSLQFIQTIIEKYGKEHDDASIIYLIK